MDTPIRLGITSTFEIAAAHMLPYHQGKCHRLHGHNYRLEFTYYGLAQGGTGSSAGMIADFGDVDADIKGVLARLDHYTLNDLPGLENPTAEHFALWLLEQLPGVDRVVVWETGRHCAHAERTHE